MLTSLVFEKSITKSRGDFLDSSGRDMRDNSPNVFIISNETKCAVTDKERTDWEGNHAIYLVVGSIIVRREYFPQTSFCMRLKLTEGQSHFSPTKTVTTANDFTDHNQGCGVGVEAGAGVGQSRSFWLESKSELESVKFCRLWLQPGAAGTPRQQTAIWAERLCILPKTLKYRKKRKMMVGTKVEASIINRIPPDKWYRI